jgi:hypothetical protein
LQKNIDQFLKKAVPSKAGQPFFMQVIDAYTQHGFYCTLGTLYAAFISQLHYSARNFRVFLHGMVFGQP